MEILDKDDNNLGLYGETVRFIHNTIIYFSAHFA